LSNADKGAVGLIPALELASLTLIGVGNYTGATIVLPELELTFAYLPGTGIFLSGTLL